MQDVVNPGVCSLHYCIHSVRAYFHYLMPKFPDPLSLSVQNILTGYFPFPLKNYIVNIKQLKVIWGNLFGHQKNEHSPYS